MPPRERVAGETATAVPVSFRLSRVVFCFLRVLCALCGFPSPCSLWFSFSGLLTPEISPAREDFHAATRASCRPDPNRRPPFRCGSLALCFVFSVSSVPSVVCFSPCPPCSLWFYFLPLRPAPPSLFGCIPAALRFVFSVSSVSSVVFLLRVLCGFSFSGVLTSDIFPARGDFHAATGASCRPGPNRHACLVAALSRCVSFSPCPLCPLWFSFPVSSVVCLLWTTNP